MYQFYDEQYKHKPANWWQIFNIAIAFNSFDGFSVDKVYCLRVWNVDIARIPITKK